MGFYDNNKTMLRYAIITTVMALIAIAVVCKAFYIATVQRSYWLEVQSRLKVDSLEIPATRGSILSSNGNQLSCNLPEYRVYMDFVALKESKADSLWYDRDDNPTPKLDSLCTALHAMFPNMTADEYKEHLRKGYDKGSRAWTIVNRRIDYLTYIQMKQLPLLSLRSGIGGFYENKLMTRNRPYGSLALSVIGTTYKEDVVFSNGITKKHGTPKSGLELTFDSILRGKPGIVHRRKVLSSWVSLSDSLPTDGCNLVTTIDVGMQDLAERALMNKLREEGCLKGVAIVMEVATGNVKAMVSLERDSLGHFFESEFNHAISDLHEPGSVFKTASFMVAIEDGYIKDTARTYVDTGCGIVDMHGSKMRDHNWSKGGYHVINVPRILQVSSNIGVSWLIDKYYGSQPEKFVDGIHRTGLDADLQLPFRGYKAPRIRRPVRNEKGKIVGAKYPDRPNRMYEWAKTTLPWMSIGYETNIPPISTLTFYNAIANNGKMVKPRFVTHAEKDGETVMEFPVEVVKEKICSDNTLHIVQDMLEKVVSAGLGKSAGTKAFRVAGKTGTALIANNGGYKTGRTSYWLSFAGYFPYDNPTHSCIVCVQYVGPSPSGGRISGGVFKEIAEGINAKRIKYPVTAAKDSASILIPNVKNGNILAADYVLSCLKLSTNGGWSGSYADGNPIWGKATASNKEVKLERQSLVSKNMMPDVHGMGARDAVYILETRGVKVKLNGRGKVTRQSKEAGKLLSKGELIQLDLS